MMNSIINSQEIGIFHCNINTCHNLNIYIIAISTGLHKFAGIKTKFKFKLKQKIKENRNGSGPVLLKETGPATIPSQSAGARGLGHTPEEWPSQQPMWPVRPVAR
jgi:hypothetical protein